MQLKTNNAMLLDKIDKPTLLLDKNKCLTNIRSMVQRAASAGVHLRPHFKTHQSKEIGRWFRGFGVDRIAVSSLRMAAYFASDQWTDITVAVPVNLREIGLIRELAGKIRLQLTAESLASLQFLEKNLNEPVEIMIEIDPGYHRTGLESHQTDTLDAMIGFMETSSFLRFKGLLSHAGHSYHANSPAAIMDIHHQSTDLFQQLVDRYQHRFPDMTASLGDTPTCSTAHHFPGATEIRPGNFVFYDLTQHHIGSCSKSQIAVAMACPVIASYSSRNQIVVYGGGVHFSKDRYTLPDGKTSFGEMVFLQADGTWQLPDTPIQVVSLSQEHGVIQADAQLLQQLQVGDLVGILPIHSCMTADCMKGYLGLDGQPIEMCKIYEW
ncbi:MAG: alanine racemase [Saprospiraceae bacterium]|nr:alanine racemase [Saprospiraceae bacterium]